MRQCLPRALSSPGELAARGQLLAGSSQRRADGRRREAPSYGAISALKRAPLCLPTAELASTSISALPLFPVGKAVVDEAHAAADRRLNADSNTAFIGILQKQALAQAANTKTSGASASSSSTDPNQNAMTTNRRTTRAAQRQGRRILADVLRWDLETGESWVVPGEAVEGLGELGSSSSEKAPLLAKPGYQLNCKFFEILHVSFF